MYYVYTIVNELGEPFYIGKGKNNRCIHHFCIYNLRKDGNKRKTNKINKIIRETGRPPEVIKLFENLSEEEAFVKEVEMIRKIGREKLTNLTDGGEGLSNPSIESREKKRLKMKNRVFTKEHRMKLSESAKGRIGTRRGVVLSDETKRKMSVASIGVKKNPESTKKAAKARCKKIDQFDANEVFIKTWDSIKEARTMIGGNIQRAVHSKTNKSKGYIWKIHLDVTNT